MQTAIKKLGPLSLNLGDINGDGTLDAVVSSEQSVTPIAGLGDGLFAPAQIDVGLDGESQGIADINGDGRLDYVSIRRRGLVVSLQKSNGSFVGREGSSTTTTGYFVAVGELNGDSSPDAVMVSLYTHIVSFLSSGSDGRLILGPPSVMMQTGLGATLADVTGDGELDLIMASPDSDSVLVSSGDGTGRFSASVSVSSSAASLGQNPWRVAVADVNGDQKIDIVTANRDTNDLSVLLGQGGGAFADPLIVPTVYSAQAAEVEDVAIGDFNGDGLLDLVAANSARDSVSVMLGFGDGVFAAPQVYPVPGLPRTLIAADLNGDGIDDIGVASYNSAVITTLSSFQHP